PAPASSVSRTCSSKESSSLVTQAIPPWAQAVFVSDPLRFVITATEPCFAALSAKLSPAIPLPITTKSYSFIRTQCCRSNGFSQRKPREREASLIQLLQSIAKYLHRQDRRNRFAPGALPRLFFAQRRRCPSQIP